ncbi:MAG: multicopper oxidase family protein [Candidatus Obscuribacter phosphatis]|uniref:Multicopper oxidase family protein n=1 Tax=Candidatus Obscuribacter phosphatis TaxID=1906157 RepID=A0A8J7TNN1_9BACT|nr:multicopper oxidase family protein [Candidatus Obscuribacter phosphatis]
MSSQVPKLGQAKTVARALAGLLSLLTLLGGSPAMAQFNEVDDLAAEQAKEKQELEKMKQELRSIKGEVNDAMRSMSELTQTMQERPMAGAGQAVHEVHLFAKEKDIDLGGGKKAHCLTYNGQVPGPEVHLKEGEPTRIVLHNELTVPTSLHFHGLVLPHTVDGLPRAGTAATKDSQPKSERYLRPGEIYAYQFIPTVQASGYYHPQVMHLKQRDLGLYGAVIVHPRLNSRSPDQELSLFINKVTVAAGKESGQKAQDVLVINGKTAPHIPAIETSPGKRLRLHIFNLSDQAVPLHLSGHRLEVVASNGSDPLEPHVIRDTVNLNPSDRVVVDILADNPGVWSLASDRPNQVSDKEGNFPSGLAVVFKYKVQ